MFRFSENQVSETSLFIQSAIRYPLPGLLEAIIERMRILVHDYAGHPFQVQLSRELARRGHEVCHAYAGGLQTPRGELKKREDDPAGFDSVEVAMNPDYAKFKYSFLKRRAMEIEYGKTAARLIAEWSPDIVISSNTPTEAQTGILAAAKSAGAAFVYWCQDFYSIAVDKLVRKKIPVLGSLIGNYYKGLDRKHFQQSDHLVAITEDFKPIMVEQFGVAAEKVAVIPNWAPLESLPVLAKENPWSKEQGLSDKFVFLYTGTLGMKHNPGLLLALAETFRDQ
ncbi:MAG: glycosyltransferase, partial [Verrucomicrobiota bacterium]